MPVDNNMPHGNHFAPNGPHPGSAGSSAGGNRRMPAPDTTEAFMMASRSGRTAKPAPAQPVANPGAGANMGGQNAYQQQSSAYQQQGRAYAADGPAGPSYGAAQAGSARNAYSAGGDPEPRKGKGRAIGLVVGLVILAIVAFGGTTGFFLYKDAKNLQAQAGTLMSEVSSMKDYLKNGEGEQLNATASTVAEQIASMRNTVNGPAWTIASFIPVYGDDIKLARGMMEQADILAQDAMLPACAQLEDFKLGNLLTDGAVNIEMLKGLITTIQDVEPVVVSSIDAIDALPEPHIGKIKSLMDKVTGPMDTAKDALEQVNGILPLLPQMLGADGPRNYLITAENNSEIRACGGFVGSLGVMNVDNGKISLQDFEGTLLSSNGPKPQIPITDEEMALFQPYEPTMNFTSGDAYFTPDFPKGASNVSTLWSLEHGGQHIDGVVALDPVFLQYLLQLCGGVTAADGTVVDGSNAANELLSGSYWKYPEGGEVQDAVFASVASGAFNQLLGGLGEVGFANLFKVIKRGGDEGRLLMWMANEAEENAVVQMGFGGTLNADPTKPQAGVFVNNYSYSKLDWYLNLDAVKGEGVKNADGTVSYPMTVTLTNEMSAADAAALPAYIAAHNGTADAPTQEMLRTLLYAPAGGTITDVVASSGSMKEATHNGLQVFYQDVRLMPGESFQVTYTVTVSAEAAEELDVRVTPTAQHARKGEIGDVLADAE